MDNQLLEDIKNGRQVLWVNKTTELHCDTLNLEDMHDASNRLNRFKPLIHKLFPEVTDGIIESKLLEISSMKSSLDRCYHVNIKGKLFLKCDNELPIAGSIKARGGIYEVLKYAETLLLANKLIKCTDDYSIISTEPYKNFFKNYIICVGSTGNLGLSIGIMAAALGFTVHVHMSKDAKEWKKELLRQKGATVFEHIEDYSKAVEAGRKFCQEHENAYFIDDEKSKDLFMGYSVAAFRLVEQLKNQDIVVDQDHPLYVYLPCGVGGAPGGITFGLKILLGDHVKCYFAEPTQSPCMMLGLVTGEHHKINVYDIGLSNVTDADGLAVASPSPFVCKEVGSAINGCYTVTDEELLKLVALIYETEKVKLEPSAAAGLYGPTLLNIDNPNATHIAWGTGGSLLPEDLFFDMVQRGKMLIPGG